MRKYNLTERLAKKNIMPVVTINDKEFEVRAKMTNFIVVMHEAKEAQKLSEKDDFDIEHLTEKVYNVIKFTLGDEAVDYIKSLDLSVEATLDLMFASITMINGGELEDDEGGEAEKK